MRFGDLEVLDVGGNVEISHHAHRGHHGGTTMVIQRAHLLEIARFLVERAEPQYEIVGVPAKPTHLPAQRWIVHVAVPGKGCGLYYFKQCEQADTFLGDIAEGSLVSVFHGWEHVVKIVTAASIRGVKP